MTKQLLAGGLTAGLVAGIVAAVLQFWLVTPLLLEGELYESGARVHFAATPDAPVQSPAGLDGGLAQEAGRHAMTLAFNVVAFVAFGLILAAAMALAARRGHRLDARRGLIWGVAGFAALHLAPALGLPPELPGTVAAELAQRQVWWLGTIVASVLGLAAIAFGRGAPVIAGGIVLILVPHVIGAPHLQVYSGIAPPELSAHFVTASLATAAAAWAVLGATAGMMLSRTGAA